MKIIGISTVIAGGLAAAVIGLAAPAGAAPAGPGSAEQTISQLQAQGYTVIVNHVGSTPLDQASVVAVRPGATFNRVDTTGDDVIPVSDRTVYVDVQ